MAGTTTITAFARAGIIITIAGRKKNHSGQQK